MENKTCKYCGKKLKDKASIERGYCWTCDDKLPTVRRLVKLCEKIKKECGK